MLRQPHTPLVQEAARDDVGLGLAPLPFGRREQRETVLRQVLADGLGVVTVGDERAAAVALGDRGEGGDDGARLERRALLRLELEQLGEVEDAVAPMDGGDRGAVVRGILRQRNVEETETLRQRLGQRQLPNFCATSVYSCNIAFCPLSQGDYAR